MEFRTIFLNGALSESFTLAPQFWQVPWYVADGGWHHVADLCRRFPHLRPLCTTWVGDGDSIAPNAVQGSALICLSLNPEKNVSDFGSILDLLGRAIRQTPKAFVEGIRLEIVGGLGGRRDQEWINVAELRAWLKQLPCSGVCHLTPGVWVATGKFEVFVNQDQLFSVFGIDACEVRGAKYEGLIALTRPSHGLSNEGLGQSVYVAPRGGGCVTLVVPE